MLIVLKMLANSHGAEMLLSYECTPGRTYSISDIILKVECSSLSNGSVQEYYVRNQ